MLQRFSIGPLASALALMAAPVLAQEGGAVPEPEADVKASLALELNDVAPVNDGCRLTFLVENGLGADLTTLSLETVVLATDGRVEQVTVFDFGTLPQDRPRVRQFDLPGLSCEAIGEVLINGVTACEGVEAEACQAGLAVSSRSDVGLTG